MSRTTGIAHATSTSKLGWGDFHLLINSIRGYAIYLLDAEGRIAMWSPGAEAMKGYSAAEVVGQHISTFYTTEDRDTDKPGRLLKIAAEKGRAKDEGWRVRRDGSLFWSMVVITALRDESGELRGFGKVVRDLTDTREAMEALRRSEERFRLLV